MNQMIHVDEVLRILEIQHSEMPDLRPNPNREVLQHNLDEFKALAKKRYRSLVKKYHPDVFPDKQLAHEKLVELNRAYRAVKSVRLITPRPVITVHINTNAYTGSGWYGGTTSSTF